MVNLLSYLRRTQSLPQGAISILEEMNFPKGKGSILIFAPHPDDESLACAGLIQQAKKNGFEIFIALITDGNKRGFQKERFEEFKRAISVLGADKDQLLFLNFPDSKLKTICSEKLKESFNEIINKLQPKMVFLPSSFDRHLDHRTAGLVLEETLKNYPKTIVYQYLVHYGYFPQPLGFRPNFYLLPPLNALKIGCKWKKLVLKPEEINLKKQAIYKYRSQLDELPSKRKLLAFIRANELFLQKEN